MDGIHGRDPNPELEAYDPLNDYQDGYLAGLAERESHTAWADPNWEPPKLLGPQGDLPFKKGDKVKIPRATMIHTTYHGNRRAGRTYTVTLHDVYDGVPAHRDYRTREVVAPQAPKALWAGTGGYWSTADLNDLI